MRAEWKEQWQAFRRSAPGKRFQERYERSREARSSQSWLVRAVKPVIAILLIAGGIFLCFVPGPGIPLLVVGLGLFADYSLTMARLLDSLEVRLRKLIKWACQWWHDASLVAKEAVVALAVLVVGGLAYGGYRILTGD